ncbi:MAG TPA: hypothetical protein VHU91_09925, partial [Mycobacteriales bacterium]|nr:hypothetical protein [Mycobacteriales bacterium]
MTALLALVFSGAFGSSALAAQIHPYTGTSFGPDGTTATSFANLQGIAVDQATGDVYALDAGEGGKVYKFDAIGIPVDFSGLAGNVIEEVGGAGNGENEIAVAPAGSPGGTAGDIYVANNSVVKIFSPNGAVLGKLDGGETCGVAVSPAGHVFVGVYPSEIREYVPTANPVTNADESPVKSRDVLSGICNVAADGLGNVYGAGYSSGPTFGLEGLADSSATTLDPTANTLAVDPTSNEVYADRRSEFAQYS